MFLRTHPHARLTLRLPLAFALVVASLTGCRGGEAFPERKSIVDSRDTEDPRSLDPALSTDVPTGRAVGYVFDGLTGFSADAKLEPRLATRWDVSPDGKTYTFHLRSGVMFSNGVPLQARHVVSSLTRVLSPATKSGRADLLGSVVGAKDFTDGRSKTVQGLSAPNDSTVVIQLVEPLSFFPKILAMPFASVLPDSVGPDFGQKPVGSGPWMLTEWKHDDHLKFARNPKYWGGSAPAESLMARIIPEPSTAVAEFEAGNVDVLVVPEGETRRWEQTDEKQARLQSAPALVLYYVGINTTRGPLTDPRVRQAINYAVDVPKILNSVMSGRGRPAAGVIPAALDGADTTRLAYAYDVNKAKQLLAEAGHPNGIDVELWHSQVPTFARLAQSIQGYLAKANIRVKLVQRDAPSVREAARAGQTDLVLKTWYADYPDAENFLYPLLHSANKGPAGNVSFYSNPAFDDLVTKARREQNDAARIALYRDADAVEFKDAPMLYLFFYNELYAVQP